VATPSTRPRARTRLAGSSTGNGRRPTREGRPSPSRGLGAGALKQTGEGPSATATPTSAVPRSRGRPKPTITTVSSRQGTQRDRRGLRRARSFRGRRRAKANHVAARTRTTREARVVPLSWSASRRQREGGHSRAPSAQRVSSANAARARATSPRRRRRSSPRKALPQDGKSGTMKLKLDGSRQEGTEAKKKCDGTGSGEWPDANGKTSREGP